MKFIVKLIGLIVASVSLVALVDASHLATNSSFSSTPAATSSALAKRAAPLSDEINGLIKSRLRSYVEVNVLRRRVVEPLVRTARRTLRRLGLNALLLRLLPPASATVLTNMWFQNLDYFLYMVVSQTFYNVVEIFLPFLPSVK